METTTRRSLRERFASLGQWAGENIGARDTLTFGGLVLVALAAGSYEWQAGLGLFGSGCFWLGVRRPPRRA